VRCEAIYFLLHLTNRFSFAGFGAEARDRMFAELAPRVLDAFIKTAFPSLSRGKVKRLRAELFGQLMIREGEYGVLSYDFDPLHMVKNVVGKFCDTVSDLSGNGFDFGVAVPQNLDAYFGLPIVVAQVLEESSLGKVVHDCAAELQASLR
jgi:hypothetical protein